MKDLITVIPDRTPTHILLRPDAVWDARRNPNTGASLLILIERDHDRLTRLQTLQCSSSLAAPPGTLTLPLPGTILLPGFVNAHTHLDLTAIGPRPRPAESSFAAWLDTVRTSRPQFEPDIAAAVHLGVERSLAGGVVAVGDIAGCTATGPTLVPWHTLAASPLAGVSFIEFFAIGDRAHERIARLHQLLNSFASEASTSHGTRLGLSPHSPYSAEPSAFDAALRLASAHNLPLTTHLAETLDERNFIQHAQGPHRTLLESLGLFSSHTNAHFGLGHHPVEHLAPYLARAHWLCAHCNDCPDHAIAILARSHASVAYCPRASDYFDAPHSLGPHRYREMLAAGINVCLGTDSIINLPANPADQSTGSLSTLDEARLLIHRDDLDPQTALAMLTTNGARALGLDPIAWTFTPGAPLAGIVALPAGRTLADSLTAVHDPVLLAICSASASRI